MKISDLVERTGVPLSTIKFYLREGLLPPGRRSAPNQARYDERHAERLDLIRALREVAGLPLESVREVIEELERGWESGDPVGAALRANVAPPQVELDADAKADLDRLGVEVRAFLDALDWTVPDHDEQLYVDSLARSLLEVRRYLHPDYPVEALGSYARVAWLLSEVEYARSPGGPRVPRPGDDLTDPTRRAVLGSIHFGRIVTALRNTANAMRSIRISADLPLPEARLLPEDRHPDAGGEAGP
jgi:DNA-binding transcriptional MerR regulator